MGTLGWYTTLARQLPASELAKMAARRAYRSARQAIYRRRESLDETRLLQAFRAGSPVELVTRAFDERLGHAWCEPWQRPFVLAALAELPGAIERARGRAEAALARRFDVFGTRVAFGTADTDWSLDPVSGHHYPQVPAPELSLLAGGSDPKYPWALGRLDHVLALAQGAWVSETEPDRDRFARGFVAEVQDFLDKNPTGIGIQWTCGMEVALRAANLAQGLVMLSDRPEVRDPAFTVRVLQGLAEHCAFVEAHLEDSGAVPNNHLVSNDVGLLVTSLLFPQLPDAARHTAMAVHGLQEQIVAQVHPDGCSFEGSIPYHRLATELFALAYVVARKCGLSLGATYAERLVRMFEMAQAYCSQAGLSPQLGDNDSGRVFPFRDREDCDHGYLAPLGAALFASPRLKAEDADLPDEAAWLLGMNGLATFRELPAGARLGACVTQGGWAVLRGAGAVLTASVGKNGQRGVGGHSHNDKLSFELHLRGARLIVDPGTGTYSRDPKVRNAFRSTASHNTVQVDGAEQVPIDPARLFALPDRAPANVELFQPGNAVDRLSARHGGYAALESPVEIERTFILDKVRRALLVTDSITGEGHHQLESRLHLPDAQARIRAATEEEQAHASQLMGAPRAFSPMAVELGPVGAPVAVVLVDASSRVELREASYSPGYGRVERALALVVQRGVTAPVRLSWAVLWM